MKLKDLGKTLAGSSREIVGTIGLLLIAFGAWEIYHPAGVITLGLEFCGVAFLFALTDEAEQ